MPVFFDPVTASSSIYAVSNMTATTIDANYYNLSVTNGGVNTCWNTQALNIGQMIYYRYLSSNLWTSYNYAGGYVCPQDTPKQKAAREKRALEMQVADSRADLLLASFLSDEQVGQYRKDKHFELVINGRTYRIAKARSGNVQLIENGKAVAKYCAHPEVWTPDGDTLLAQLLMLKSDEAGFLKIANRTALQ